MKYFHKIRIYKFFLNFRVVIQMHFFYTFFRSFSSVLFSGYGNDEGV